MSFLFRLLYATQARGTHHKLAMDALLHLSRPDAVAWQRVFLSHADRYLAGAKAPDDVFKDFKNHVLHPRDGYWGGAPQTAARWYRDLVSALGREDWSEAAWCAGVLSHYYSDPIHPFHTAQSVAENNIHRAVEWSINRAYDSLRREGLAAAPKLAVGVPEGPDWLAAMIKAGADRANRHYEALIAHYDVTRGVVDPPSGLDQLGRRLVAELLVYAATGFARILERAIAEAGVTPPDVDLTAETVLAALKIPMQMVLKKLSDIADRRKVEAMYDELLATGRVDKNLPEDDRAVRDLHASEVLGLPAADAPGQTSTPPEIMDQIAPLPVSADLVPPAEPEAVTMPTMQIAGDDPDAPADRAEAESAVPERLGQGLARLDTSRLRRRLHLGDDVERAPSIGPKTAVRLHAVGLRTVSDLLDANATEAADRLAARHITAEVVVGWQDQARLCLAIPGLSGTAAQLLTGAGFRSAEALAAADAATVGAEVLRFATTPAGQRILRDGKAPDLADVQSWIERAAAIRAA